jgi:hypothetical protein
MCAIMVLYFQVFDATNSTWDRRQMIKEIVVNKMGFKLFFVESVCDDPQIIEQNIMVSHSKFMLCTTLLKNGEKLKVFLKKNHVSKGGKILSVLAEQVSGHSLCSISAGT